MNRWSRLKPLLALALSLSAARLGAAQATPPSPSPAPAAAKEKMRPFDFLVGDWEGDAWVQMGPGPRQTVRQRERVRWMVDGEVLLIEGRGTQRDATTGTERVVHDALATIAWDPTANRHVMWTYRARGGPGAPEIAVEGKSIVWALDTPRGRVRYTISLDPQGRWVERGEHSADGTQWTEFFGMTLERTPAAAP